MPETPPPAPSSPPAYWDAELCDRTRPVQQRQELLLSIIHAELKSVKSVRSGFQSAVLPTCIDTRTVTDEEAILFTARAGQAGALFAVFAWKAGEQWQAMPVVPPTDGWAGVQSLMPLHVSMAAGKPALLLIGHDGKAPGSAGLLHGAPGVALTRVSESYRQATFKYLPPDMVLVTFGDPPTPDLAWTCTLCVGANRQALLRWIENAYTETAQRTFQDPFVVANLFLGAVKANKLDEAARYAMSEEIAARVVKSLGHGITTHRDDVIKNPPWEAEQLDWAELPAGVRKPFPDSLNRYHLKFDLIGTPARLYMGRVENRWVVMGLEQ